jgi:hypothetical protein
LSPCQNVTSTVLSAASSAAVGQTGNSSIGTVVGGDVAAGAVPPSGVVSGVVSGVDAVGCVVPPSGVVPDTVVGATSSVSVPPAGVVALGAVGAAVTAGASSPASMIDRSLPQPDNADVMATAAATAADLRTSRELIP